MTPLLDTQLAHSWWLTSTQEKGWACIVGRLEFKNVIKGALVDLGSKDAPRGWMRMPRKIRLEPLCQKEEFPPLVPLILHIFSSFLEGTLFSVGHYQDGSTISKESRTPLPFPDQFQQMKLMSSDHTGRPTIWYEALIKELLVMRHRSLTPLHCKQHTHTYMGIFIPSAPSHITQ